MIDLKMQHVLRIESWKVSSVMGFLCESCRRGMVILGMHDLHCLSLTPRFCLTTFFS